MTPLAVVIPVYNGEAFVARAVESVRRQSMPPATILVVDDCSTDGTRRVVEALARQDARVRLLALPENGGPSAARNAALRALDEPLVAMVDADDQWLPEHLELLHAGFGLIPGADVAFTHTQSVEEGAAGDAAIRPVTGSSVHGARAVDPWPRFLRENFVPQSAVMVRRAAVLAAGGYRPEMRYGEDYELWMRMALAGSTFAEVPVGSCVRRVHAAQVSSRNAGRMYRSAWQSRRAVVEALFGHVDRASDATRDALLAAADEDLRGAWHSRRKDVVQDAIAAVRWTPGSERLVTGWESRLRRRWHVWRTAAFVWDALPESFKARIRSVRR